MDRTIEQQLPVGRRGFLSSGAGVPCLAAVGELLRGRALADQSAPPQPPRAKRLISLFQSGAPSQLDLFDYKPGLSQRAGSELPESVRQGQRLTGMKIGRAHV